MTVRSVANSIASAIASSVSGAGDGGGSSTPLDIAGLTLWLDPAPQYVVYGESATEMLSASTQSYTSNSTFDEADLGTGDFSLCFSFYRYTTGNQTLVAKYADANNYWRLEINASNLLHFIAVAGGVTKIEVTGTTAVTNTSRWYHVTVIVDRDSTAATDVFVNGILDTSGTPTVSTDDIDNTGKLYIGQSGASSLYFNGRAARIGIFQSLLSQSQAEWLAYGVNGRFHEELATNSIVASAYWDCGQAESLDLIDAAGTNDIPSTGGSTRDDAGPLEASVIDSSGNGYHGHITDTSPSLLEWWSDDVPSGQTGYSINHPETDTIAVLNPSNVFNPSSAVTFSGWCKPSRTDGRNDLLANVGGFLYLSVSAGKAVFFVFDGSSRTATGATTLSADQWYHITGTWDKTSGNVLVYVNGVLDGSTTGATGTPGGAGAEVRIGGDTSQQFKGNLKDIRWYNSELSAAEITALAAGTSPAASPLAQWLCNDTPLSLASGGVHDNSKIYRIASRVGSTVLKQATSLDEPLYLEQAANGNPGMYFLLGGISAYLKSTSVPLSAFSSGSVAIAWINATSFSTEQVLFSSSDEATTNHHVQVGIDTAGKVFIQAKSAGTAKRVTGGTVMIVDSVHYAIFSSSGTSYEIILDGVAETLVETTGGDNDGTWYADLTGLDNTTLGALVDTAERNNFKGTFLELLATSAAMSADEKSIIHNWFTS